MPSDERIGSARAALAAARGRVPLGAGGDGRSRSARSSSSGAAPSRTDAPGASPPSSARSRPVGSTWSGSPTCWCHGMPLDTAAAAAIDRARWPRSPRRAGATLRWPSWTCRRAATCARPWPRRWRGSGGRSAPRAAFELARAGGSAADDRCRRSTRSRSRGGAAASGGSRRRSWSRWTARTCAPRRWRSSSTARRRLVLVVRGAAPPAPLVRLDHAGHVRPPDRRRHGARPPCRRGTARGSPRSCPDGGRAVRARSGSGAPAR